ncbi:RraA family protein [Segeticoccus rhizosphaerae]|jgi:RraA family protein|uniref:RraA family protein n=1 Tax=Segeticoccus rhizosphaerae TaxID=1104777 RepID=UPI0010BF96F5|nr:MULTISPECIES: dimethylmenaquinone methyltransferase [Intrasporangiaceae]
MSKSHPREWEIHHEVPRPDAEIVKQLSAYPTTQIADSGGPVSVLGPGIAHRCGEVDVCGPATTVWTRPGDILFPLKSTDLVQSGDVLVIDGGGRLDAALVGDVVSATLLAAGCRGVVVDGVIRDVEGIEEVGLPVYARGAHPATGSGEGPGAINVPIQCGGVLVRPGDVVRADRSGVVVIPGDRVGEVLEKTRAVDQREAKWRAAINGGATLPAATGIDARIAELRDVTKAPRG